MVHLDGTGLQDCGTVMKQDYSEGLVYLVGPLTVPGPQLV